jgi:large subunit ribosomal protein L25
MQKEELTITRREGTGKEVARRLRRRGVVPAVLYGGPRSEAVTVDPRAVLRLLQRHEGSNPLVTLKLDGDADARLAIIRDLQFHPVTENLLHVDFQEVSADREITIRVPIHTVGESIGVKDDKGSLTLVLHELDIACLPTMIPEGVAADVSPLRIGDVLTVADLQAPPGVRILNPGDQAVATVRPPMAEEAPVAAVTPVATAEPEVLTERKAKEDEGEDSKKGKK